MKPVLLFSGGLDSYIAYHYLHNKTGEYPKTVYFDLHTPYAQRELKVVKELIPETIVEDCLDLHNRQYGEKAYIPYRNLYLAMLASHYADHIIIAGVKDDMVPDKNKKAFDLMSMVLTQLSTNTIVTISSPFWDCTKEYIVKWFLQNVGCKDLLKTISCYDDKEKTNYCGECPSCFRKWVALKVNGYSLPFKNISLALRYYNDAQHAKFVKSRCDSIITAVEEAGFV